LNIASRNLRANPAYKLVLREQLDPFSQGEFGRLIGDQNYYAVLQPLDSSGVSFKAISREAAFLFEQLGVCDSAGGYRHLAYGLNDGALIHELVLADIVQIEMQGIFVSGPAAQRALGPSTKRSPAHGVSAKLSRAALEHASRLPEPTPSKLSGRLYFFNRIPASASWRHKFRSPEAIRSLLGLDRVLVNSLQSYSTNSDSEVLMHGWWSWHATDRDPGYRSKPTYKLYVSPHCSAIAEGFRETVEVLTQRRTRVFKIGADVHGLLRPDKLVAYFPCRASLEEAAGELQVRLAGCPVQGVPFSSDLSEDGLLSWGTDPPPNGSTSGFRHSWRSWITYRLATLMCRAMDRASLSDPVEYALTGLEAMGVNVNDWQMDLDRWTASSGDGS
jgi:hypothetical protein